MIMWGYALPGLIILAILLTPFRVTRYGRFLSWLTVANTVICLGLSVLSLRAFSLPQYYMSGEYLSLNSLSIYEALIASFIFLLAALYAQGYVRSLLRAGEINRENVNLFYGAFNLLHMVVIFAFYANNLALFWILVELTTIISAILIVTLNAKENILAALKYVFTASSAMLFSFIGILLVFAMTKQALGTGILNWNELLAQAKNLPSPLFTLAFGLMFVGFAAKAGIAPFHTWLPPAHAKAPSVVSALLSAVLLNIGIYGILRIYSIAHQTASARPASLTLIAFGIFTMGVAAFSMLSRENIKKLIAFSSIEHMGMMIIGIGLGTPPVLLGVLLYTLGHSLIKSLLFFSAGILHRQFGSDKFYDMNNVLRSQPLAAAGVIIGGAAIIGTPVFPLFFAKLSILIGLAEVSNWLLFVVLVLILIVAASFAIFIVRTCCQTNEMQTRPYQAPWSLKLPIITLLVLIVALGIVVPRGLSTMLTDIIMSLGF